MVRSSADRATTKGGWLPVAVLILEYRLGVGGVLRTCKEKTKVSQDTSPSPFPVPCLVQYCQDLSVNLAIWCTRAQVVQIVRGRETGVFYPEVKVPVLVGVDW